MRLGRPLDARRCAVMSARERPLQYRRAAGKRRSAPIFSRQGFTQHSYHQGAILAATAQVNAGPRFG
jgi:hypothetical protein